MNVRQLAKSLQGSRRFSLNTALNVNKERAIDREPVTFVGDKKTTFINRLYVWGHSGTGSLGK